MIDPPEVDDRDNVGCRTMAGIARLRGPHNGRAYPKGRTSTGCAVGIKSLVDQSSEKSDAVAGLSEHAIWCLIDYSEVVTPMWLRDDI